MKIKNCPFCGGEAQLVPHSFYNEEKDKFEVAIYGVICAECYAQSGQFNDSEEEAIEVWNTRKPIDKVVEQIHEYFKSEIDSLNGEEPWDILKYNKAVCEIVKGGQE